MKKLIIATIAATGIASSVFAQGTLNFASFVPTYIGAQTNSTTYSSFFGGGSAVGGAQGATAVAASGFYYELLFAASGTTTPTTLTALGTWSDSGFYANNSTGSAGRLQVGNGNNGIAVTGMSVGTAYSIILAAWSANLGTSWSTVYSKLNTDNFTGVVGNAFFGLSTVGTVTPTTTTAPGATIFGASPLINSPSTQLYLVTPAPEPGTMALAALGGASLLLFRRRK